MSNWHLNSIAARLAVTILLAIVLGVALEVTLGPSIARFTGATLSSAPGPGDPAQERSVSLVLDLNGGRDLRYGSISAAIR